jgi:hypothetical protein
MQSFQSVSKVGKMHFIFAPKLTFLNETWVFFLRLRQQLCLCFSVPVGSIQLAEQETQ